MHPPCLSWHRSSSHTHTARLHLPPAHLESICLPTHLLSVTFDRSPPTRIELLLQPHTHLSPPPPKRLHFSPAARPRHWSHPPRDANFLFNPTHSVYEAHVHLSESDQPALGLSFVIELQTGYWLRAPHGRDFYMGFGPRSVPCFIDAVLPTPPAFHPSPRHLLNLYRVNPFWLQPGFGRSLATVDPETQFILYCTRTTSGSEQEGGEQFTAMLATVDSERGVRAGFIGIGGSLVVRVENGRCEPLNASCVRGFVACVVGVGRSPYEAVRRVVEESARVIDGFCSRLHKWGSRRWADIMHGSMLDKLGYCTWDAFGHEVGERVIVESLRWLKREQLSVGFVVVDDGWQGGGEGGPDAGFQEDGREVGKARLRSLGTNDKFGGCLGRLSGGSDVDVVAWAAIIGYWGGCCGAPCGLQTFRVNGAVSEGLRVNDSEGSARWEGAYEVVGPGEEAVSEFYDAYFVQSMAREQGITGVKLDAQSILEVLCNAQCEDDGHRRCSGGVNVEVTRSRLAMAYRRALTRAVEEAFPRAIVMNCMSCGPEMTLLSGAELTRANVCWRTSNDHAFPGVEEHAGAVAWHILSNCLNNVFLGEIFPVTDWDMFRCDDESSAGIHAAARVLSGGPLYFSDTTPISANAKRLLNSLTTSYGKVLRCLNPGLPTRDCLFQDPRERPRKLLKIFNRSAVVNIIGLFNLDSSDEAEDIGGSFCPADVEDISHLSKGKRHHYLSLAMVPAMQAARHCDAEDEIYVRVAPMTAALVHICPALELGHGMKFAILGQPRFLNCGGAVASVSISKGRIEMGSEPVNCIIVDCALEDYGETYMWLNDLALSKVIKVRSHGESIEHRRVMVSDICMIVVCAPNRVPFQLQLLIKI